MTVNEERVKEKLREALCNLHNTEINFANEVTVKGLLGFTLDKKTILMVDIAETFLRDVPSFVSQGGQTSVTLKSMAQKDNTAKRPAVRNVNESCKRQKICVSGSEPPSILSALTNAFPNRKSIEDGIAHKHQVNRGFTMAPTLADPLAQHEAAAQPDEVRQEVRVKDEPVSDDDDANMQEEDAQMELEGVKEERSSGSGSPLSSPGPFSTLGVADTSGGGATGVSFSGINMFANMYNSQNPLYTPFQGVHHRYQMENDSSNMSSRKQYHCDQCSYSSQWPSNLRRHKQKHVDPDYRPAMVHVCEKCEYKTGWLSNLRRHMRTVHGENQEKVYECPSCATIQIAKEEPVKCKKCKRSYTSSDTYKQHVQSIIQQQQLTGGMCALGGGGETALEEAVRKITSSVLGASASGGGEPSGVPRPVEPPTDALSKPGLWLGNDPSGGLKDRRENQTGGRAKRWDVLPARLSNGNGQCDTSHQRTKHRNLFDEEAESESTQDTHSTPHQSEGDPAGRSVSSAQRDKNHNPAQFQDAVANTSASFLMKRMRDVYGWTEGTAENSRPKMEVAKS